MFTLNLKEARVESGMTRKDVAKYLNIHESTYGKYELGRREPSFEVINKLSALFGVSTDYLLGKLETNILRIPVLGKIPAGIPIEAIEDIDDYEEAPASWLKGGKEFFALRISGNSMLPEYRDKDTIIFKQQPTCENGEDCAVMVNSYDATFKRVEWNYNGIILKPLNPAFETFFYSNEEVVSLPVKILGVFWELRRSRHL